MSAKILILNGPNLNMLGKREPGVYGSKTLDDVISACTTLGNEVGLAVESYQSNHEGDLVTRIQEAGQAGTPIVFNPGAYSHTSIALRDAITSANAHVIEVHISNIHAREEFRHVSYISAVANGVIAGCGTDGYLMAIRVIANQLQLAEQTKQA
ncbi:type II 3-dehydroquinate dehydratase [Ahrensia kielensis]|jgi:3-dehydroquinate dehydratase II|uniref:3-dehydroquinate dehydratase n=1 Tax=Ahrensia kielensis TaxID=76980 RepID=A0ABU9T3P9_9HYPH|nr:type II 3-dehydroquinate dehydratase [Ahrensia sp. 13_GOM-1096m]